MEGRQRKASRVVGLDVGGGGGGGGGGGRRQKATSHRDAASVLSVASSSWTAEGSARVSRNRKGSHLARTSGLARIDGGHEKKPPELAVMHFVYSEAVEKAIRRGYKTSALPPLTGGHFRRENTYQVSSVPDIFSDLVATRRIRKRNVEREQEYRKSLPDLTNHADAGAVGGTGLSRIRMKLAAATGVLDRMRATKLGGTGAGSKLPSLLLSRARQLSDSSGINAAKDT